MNPLDYLDQQPKQDDFEPMKALVRAYAQQQMQKLQQSRSINQAKTSPEPLGSTQGNSINNMSLSNVSQPVGMAGALFDNKFKVSQKFGNYNPGLYAGRTKDAKHWGLDIATPAGTQLRSPVSGNVEYGQSKDFGNFIKVTADDGTQFQFSHLSNVDDLVKQISAAKQKIAAGLVLGLTGSTGYSTAPHLDVMAWRGGKTVDPSQFDAIRRSLL